MQTFHEPLAATNQAAEQERVPPMRLSYYGGSHYDSVFEKAVQRVPSTGLKAKGLTLQASRGQFGRHVDDLELTFQSLMAATLLASEKFLLKEDIARIAAAEAAAATTTTAGGAAATAAARASKAISSNVSSPPSLALGRATGCSSNGGSEAKGEGKGVARSGKCVRWNTIADDESFLVEVCEFKKDELVTSVKRDMALCLWTTDGMLVIFF